MCAITLVHNRPGDFFCPFFSGPSGFPQSGTSLIGTGLVGLLSNQPSIFIPENRPGLNPSLGG